MGLIDFMMKDIMSTIAEVVKQRPNGIFGRGLPVASRRRAVCRASLGMLIGRD